MLKQSILFTPGTGCLGEFPDTKNTLSLEQRFMEIYHWVLDLSHSSKYFVGEFCEMQCHKIVITLQLTISPCSYNTASHKLPNKIFAAVA
jgi:hypothetical protein